MFFDKRSPNPHPAYTRHSNVVYHFLLTQLLLMDIDGCNYISIVPHVKLLGLIISNDLKWALHVYYIRKKAAKRLYTLRLLKRSIILPNKLVHAFNTCIRPILVYSCEVWHYSLPQYLNDQTEKIQRRALRIIFPDCPYDKWWTS